MRYVDNYSSLCKTGVWTVDAALSSQSQYVSETVYSNVECLVVLLAIVGLSCQVEEQLLTY